MCKGISLSNAEGKLCFSLISKQFESHLVQNSKMTTLILQKRYMEKVPG